MQEPWNKNKIRRGLENRTFLIWKVGGNRPNKTSRRSWDRFRDDCCQIVCRSKFYHNATRVVVTALYIGLANYLRNIAKRSNQLQQSVSCITMYTYSPHLHIAMFCLITFPIIIQYSRLSLLYLLFIICLFSMYCVNKFETK